MTTVYIIRLRQISTGAEADSMLFSGTEAEAWAYAASAVAGFSDLEIISIRPSEAPTTLPPWPRQPSRAPSGPRARSPKHRS
jgi:hypothetical protein